MTEPAEPIRHFYADWAQYRSRLVDGIRDAFHSGEISQLLGANGLPPIDL